MAPAWNETFDAVMPPKEKLDKIKERSTPRFSSWEVTELIRSVILTSNYSHKRDPRAWRRGI